MVTLLVDWKEYQYWKPCDLYPVYCIIDSKSV